MNAPTNIQRTSPSRRRTSSLLRFILHPVGALVLALALALAVGMLVIMDVHPIRAQSTQQTQQTEAAGGQAYAWGWNVYGALGDGTSIYQRNTPVQVSNLSGVTAIDGGTYQQSLALKDDGTVWAWGENGSGQLGDGTISASRSTPVQVKGPNGEGYLSGAVAIAAGGGYNLALKDDGTVWAWGENSNGQLGDGTTTDRTTPVQVKGLNGEGYLSGVSAIAADGSHSLALNDGGTVWAWGYNRDGQLGDGTTTDRTIPVQVKGLNGEGYLSGVSAIGTGVKHSLALKNDGTVWAWGSNYDRWDEPGGQLGDGTYTSRTTPVQVKGPNGEGYLSGVSAIGTGFWHSLAIKNDGTLWAWGSNFNGALGDGTDYYPTPSRNTPVQVKGPNGEGYLSGVTAVDGGAHHSLAIKNDGSLWAWGKNFYGQLGDSTFNRSLHPVQVKGPNGEGYLSGVSAIGTCGEYSLAVVLSDTSAPTTNASATTADGNTYNSSEWTNQDVTITLTAADEQDGSGVKETRYRIGTSGDYQLYDASNKPSVSSEGVTEVSFYSTDNTGNTEDPPKTFIVKIDKSAPSEPTASFLNSSGNPVQPLYTDTSGVKWFNQPVTVQYDGSTDPDLVDGSSGSGNISYTPEDTHSTDGTYDCSGTATDQAGNVSSPTSLKVGIDSNAPATTANAGGYNSDEWTNQDVTLTLTASDEGGSGVDKIFYMTDGSTTYQEYTAPLSLTSEGTKTVSYYATDKATNQGETKTFTVKIDKSAPTTSPTLSAQPNANGWYNKDVTITLSATDQAAGSGIKEITYSTTGAQQVTETKVPGSSTQIPITTEGQTTITYFATDNASNAEQPKALTIKLDKSAPRVMSVTPANNATGVSRGTNVTATFSENMDKSLLTGALGKANFKLYKVTATGDVQITNVSATPNLSGRKATLNPYGTSTTLLARSTRYKAVVTTAVKDLAGNTMATQKVWYFKTGT